jgi:hypothetical protein
MKKIYTIATFALILISIMITGCKSEEKKASIQPSSNGESEITKVEKNKKKLYLKGDF